MSQCPVKNLLDPDTYVNGMPYSELAELRRQGSVLRMDDPLTGVPYWVVTRQAELDFVSKHPELFSSAAATPFPMEQAQEDIEAAHHMIIGMDPPQHQRHRRVVREAFTPKAVESYQPRLERYAKQIVDRVAARGECEFVRDVAAELPLITILEILGVPISDRDQFFEWTNTAIFADDPDMSVTREDGQMAVANMIAYAMQLAEQRRKQPGNEMVDTLLNGQVDGNPISELEFGMMFVLLMVGGNESTRTVIAHGMRLLMEHPEQLAYLVAHPEHIDAAIEEILRYNTPFISMRRTAMADVELGGASIRAGDKVILHYSTVNHDESVFGDDATTFNIHRAIHGDVDKQLRSFGIGQHFCIGSHLARMELRVMFKELIPRLKHPRLTGPIRYTRSYFVNAIKSMPIAFDC